MAVLFDLDQTLVDSESAKRYRDRRDWSSVYPLIPNFKLFNGIREIISHLKERKVPLGLVTSSPRLYCSKVLEQFNLSFDAVVCYHDTKRHKPYPDPLHIAIKRLGVDADKVIAIGDDPKDIVAAAAAGTFSVGCCWGCLDIPQLHASKPDLICTGVADLASFLAKRYDIKT